MSDNTRDKLKKLLLQSYKNNLRIRISIGKHLKTIVPEYTSDCDLLEKLNIIATDLQREGITTSLKDLYDMYTISCKLDKKENLPVSWTGAKQKYLIPPDGNCSEIDIYWQDAISNAETSHVVSENELYALIDKANHIPDTVKTQIQGYNVISNKHPIRKIAHTADWHFADDSTIDETIQAAGFFTETIINENCDLVVIAGDILDRRLNHDSTALNALTDILYTISSHCPVYILCGTKNHDGLTLRILEKIRTRFPIYTANTPSATILNQTFHSVENIPGTDKSSILIFGIPPVSPSEYTNIYENIIPQWKEIRKKYNKTPAILVGHISLAEALPYDSVVFQKETLEQTDCDLYLLGHIHNAKAIDKFFYSGSLISKNFGEKAEKGFWIHEISPEIKSQWVPNPKAKKVVEIEVDTPDALTQISQIIPENAKVKVHVKQTDNINNIKEALVNAGASEIKIEKEVTPVYVTRIKGFSNIQNIKEKLNKVFDLMKITPEQTVLEKIDIINNPEFETKIEETYNNLLREVLNDSN